MVASSPYRIVLATDSPSTETTATGVGSGRSPHQTDDGSASPTTAPTLSGTVRLPLRTISGGPSTTPSTPINISPRSSMQLAEQATTPITKTVECGPLKT